MAKRIFLFRVIPLLLIACCLLGIYLSVRWALGDMYAYKVRYAISEWEREPSQPAQAPLDSSLDDINTALFFEPRNPEYIELKARLILYSALNKDSSSDGLAEIAKAKQAHLAAIELRPQWPYSWANLVLMKAYLGEWDGEHERALRNAVNYGPWETSVHQTLTYAALLSWNSLTQEQKHIHAENMDRGLAYNYKSISGLIINSNNTNAICAYLSKGPQQEKLCNS
uniref:hypothetical protein n=1 Tax=Marinobacterium profundum TaxID=1714300 RepID=UPI0008364AC3|nr:hypothetical protein [Marinobacterium profundum]